MKKKIIDSIDVKTPCNESWDEMFGNDEVRFCSHCAKNVHNLSAMTRRKAEELVKNSNGKLCVRYVKDPNGKIVNVPPRFVKIKRQAAIAASVLASSLAFSTLTYAQGEPIKPKDNSTQTKKDKKSETKQNLAMLSGTVTDEMGSVIPEAKIILRDLVTKVTRETQTNYAGFYEFTDVEPKNYNIETIANGFNIFLISNFEITKSSKIIKNLILKANTEIVGDLIIIKEPIEKTPAAEISNKVELRRFEDLPLNSQTVTTMGLIPGVHTEEKPKTSNKSKPKKKKT